MQITLTLNCEIERYKVGEWYYCTFKLYNLNEKSSINYDEAETKLIDKIFKYVELNIWNQDLQLKLNVSYK